MVDATSAKLVAVLVGSSKTKVGDGDPETVIEAEDVLWLQISVVDTERVAVLDSVEQLQEDVLDEAIVPKIAAAMQDLGEEIVIRRIIHNDICVGALVHNAVEGDHARVCRGELVQGDFADVDLSLAWGLMP